MGDFFFVIKSFLVTLLILLGLQQQMGGRTIEERLQTWIQASAITHDLRDIGLTAYRVGLRGLRWMGDLVASEAGHVKSEGRISTADIDTD